MTSHRKPSVIVASYLGVFFLSLFFWGCDPSNRYDPFVLKGVSIKDIECENRMQVFSLTDQVVLYTLPPPEEPPRAGYSIQIMMGEIFSGGAIKPCMGYGTEYQIQELIKGRDIQVITEQSAYPLTFKAVKDVGFVYLCGRGIVKTPSGEFQLGYSETLDTWIKRLTDKRQYVREGACEALGWLAKSLDEKDKAVPALIQSLKDESWEVRRNAAESLGRIGDKRAISALSDLADSNKENNSIVSSVVEEAIKIITADPSVKMGEKQGIMSINFLDQ